MEEQITETGTDGLTAPSADELRAVEEISEEALADAETAAETGDITDSLGLYLRESGRHALLTAEEEVELAAAAAAGSEIDPREEKQFANLGELKAQLELDKQAALG